LALFFCIFNFQHGNPLPVLGDGTQLMSSGTFFTQAVGLLAKRSLTLQDVLAVNPRPSSTIDRALMKMLLGKIIFSWSVDADEFQEAATFLTIQA